MNTSARLHSSFYKFLLLVLAFSLTSCGGTEVADPATPLGDEGPAVYEMPRLLGFVINPDGDPVAYAEVGGEDIATEDGVASGDFLDYQGGWIPVTALGYASGYAKDASEDLDFPFFVTHLTPYQSMMRVKDEKPFTLSASSENQIYLSAEISQDLFQDPSPLVGLAVIDRSSVSPILAPYPEGEGLRLRSAFALEAFDEDWLPADLNPGSLIPLTLELPVPLSEMAKFARFDRSAGEWQSMDLGCEIAEGNLYTCYLDSPDPLIGIFDQEENLSAGNTHSAKEGSAALEGKTIEWDEFTAAVAALQDWIKDQIGGVSHTDPELIKLVEKIAKIAQDYAKDNRNESGKSMLAEAAVHAGFGMQEGIVKELTDEMASIAEEVAKDALKETDCGEYGKMIKAAEQVQYLMTYTSLADQLQEKVKTMVVDCDVWVGNITVFMPVSAVHQTGLTRSGGGPGAWIEFHRIKLSTNVKTHAMFGEDWVRLSFPEVTYRREEPCLKQIKMSGTGDENLITIEGFFDGYNFLVTLVSPQGAGGSIHQSWRTEAKQEGECELIRENNFTFAPFHSFLTHGVSGEAPLLAYADILDTKDTDKTGSGYARLSGSANIDDLDPEMGIYPAAWGTVDWRLFHEQFKLPLTDE